MIDEEKPMKTSDNKKQLELATTKRWFHEGQTVVIDGNLFTIKKVKPGELILKLVKRKPGDVAG